MLAAFKFFKDGLGAVLIDKVVEIELKALIHDLGHLLGGIMSFSATSVKVEIWGFQIADRIALSAQFCASTPVN